MLIKEAKTYRNYLNQHEYDLTNNQINVETLEDWQKLYNELKKLKTIREKLTNDVSYSEKVSLNNSLKDEDDYLNSLLYYMESEINIYEKKGYEITDNIVKNLFEDIKTLCSYNYISKKISHIEENVPKKSNDDDLTTWEKFVNNYGQTIMVPSSIAHTYENLLLKQMELVDGYNRINYTLLSPLDEYSKEKPIKFDLMFYLSQDLVSKKIYVEKVIDEIIHAQSKYLTKVEVAGKTYQIPRQYKALFLDLQLKLKITTEHIEKMDMVFVIDNSKALTKPIGYEIKKIEEQDLEKIDYRNLTIDNATNMLIEVLKSLLRIFISKSGKESSRKDTIVYKDNYNIYYVNKSNEAKFKDLYSKRISLEERLTKDNVLEELRNRLNFLKTCLTNSSLTKEMDILTDVFCEYYERKMLEKESKLDNILACKEIDRSFYKRILLNINNFLHSKKLSSEEKRVNLTTLDRITNYSEPTIKEGLEFLDLNANQSEKLENVKPSKNIDKLLGSLNKILPFIQANILDIKKIKASNIEKDLNQIEDLTTELALKKQELLKFLDEEGIKR